MSKKVSLAGRKRTKDLQAETSQIDATKQTLLQMQKEEEAKVQPQTPSAEQTPEPKQQTPKQVAPQTPEPQATLPLDTDEKITPQARRAVAPKGEPNPKPVTKMPTESVVKAEETSSKTKDKAASTPEQFEKDAVKYLLSVYKKLCGGSETCYDFSPYQRNKKLIHYFKRVINARAEVHAAEGMSLQENQLACQAFVEHISTALNTAGIEIRKLNVVPE